jgi:hypothetical protein
MLPNLRETALAEHSLLAESRGRGLGLRNTARPGLRLPKPPAAGL